MRKPCKECPWENNHKHSKAWMTYAEKMTQVGKIDDQLHNCHLITSDTWGEKEPITVGTVCMGAIKSKNAKL